MPQPSTQTARAEAFEALGFVRTGDGDGLRATTDAGPSGRVRVVARWPAMSTLVTVTAVGRSEARIAAALDGAFAEMDRLIGIFDRRRADTALAVLNADGRLDGPPPELADVARRAAHLHRLTGGAFDPTVAPLVDLVLRAARAPVPRAPDVAELADARALTGMADVELSGRRIRLGRAGQALTLDGIAKGAIVDAVAAVLERGGVRDYCIEAGGDIRTGGTREPGRPWTIAVRDPDGPGTLPGRLSLSGGAVATSGPYERGPHVVDPAAGRAADGLRSVSVAAPSAALADALATAVVVLRPAAGRALIERLPGCACLLIRSDGTRIASARWKESA